MQPPPDHDNARPRPARAERLFLDWDRPFLPTVASLLAERYEAGGELRMESVVLAVPGGRAGRRLKELLLAESERRECRLTPPRVVTVGALPELLSEPEAPVASGAVSRRAWVLALRGLPKNQLRQLVATTPAMDDVRGWSRLARTVEALHREVAGAGLGFGDVARLCAADPFFDDSQRWTALAEAQTRYRSVLDGLGLGDAGLSRLETVAGGSARFEPELWLVGIVEMPAVVKAMLRGMRSPAPVRVLVHAPGSESAAFDDLGCVVPPAWVGREVPIPEEALVVAGRPGDQAEEAIRAIAGLGGRYAADEITVAVPEDEVVPYLEQRLRAAGAPVRRATGRRLARMPAVRLLGAMADYLDGNRYDACAALARHPDLWRWIRRAGGPTGGPGTGALGQPDGWLGALDEHFSKRLPRRVGPGESGGRSPADAVVGALCRVLGHERLLGKLSGSSTIGAWMPAILELLVQVYGENELDRAKPHERDLLDSLVQLRNAAGELHRLPPEVDESVDAATAIRLLLDDVAELTISPHGEDAAIELLGWLEIHLDDAPVTVVTGFNEGTLPESVNAHAYLPDGFRSRIGLVDNHARYARDAYQLTALLHSKAELRLIAGRQTVRGDPLRPSRLMFAVGGDALARRVKRFYGAADAAPAGGAHAPGTGADAVVAGPGVTAAPPPSGDPGRRPAAEDASAFALPPEPMLRPAEPIRRLSVSQFGAVLTDPYLFALRSVLRLEPLDDSAAELDGLGFGNLAHQVLQRFGESPAAASDDPGAVRAELDRQLDRVVAERHGADAVPAVRVQAEQLRARLHAFARWQAAWAGSGWRIVAVECRTPPEGVELEVDGEPFTISGRVDRIDHNPGTGGWAVFDYKTGDRGDVPDKTHRRGRGADRVWVDLQLPLYRHILPHVVDTAGERPFAAASPDDVRLGYILLPRDSSAVGDSFADWSTDELAEAEEAARDVVRLLRRGEFLWDPGLGRRVPDPRMAALLGIGHLEAAVSGDDAEASDD